MLVFYTFFCILLSKDSSFLHCFKTFSHFSLLQKAFYQNNTNKKLPLYNKVKKNGRT